MLRLLRHHFFGCYLDWCLMQLLLRLRLGCHDRVDLAHILADLSELVQHLLVLLLVIFSREVRLKELGQVLVSFHIALVSQIRQLDADQAHFVKL
jgi:hypothetical protein